MNREQRLTQLRAYNLPEWLCEEIVTLDEKHDAERARADTEAARADKYAVAALKYSGAMMRLIAERNAEALDAPNATRATSDDLALALKLMATVRDSYGDDQLDESEQWGRAHDAVERLVKRDLP